MSHLGWPGKSGYAHLPWAKLHQPLGRAGCVSVLGHCKGGIPRACGTHLLQHLWSSGGSACIFFLPYAQQVLARINIGKRPFFLKNVAQKRVAKICLAKRVLDPWLSFTQVGKNFARLAKSTADKLSAGARVRGCDSRNRERSQTFSSCVLDYIRATRTVTA